MPRIAGDDVGIICACTVFPGISLSGKMLGI